MARFTDTNHIPELLKILKKVNKKTIEAGILGDAGKNKDGESIAAYAAANEFGTNKAGRNKNVTIPERSFIRSTFDNKKSIDRVFKNVDRILVPGVNVKKILNNMGLTIKGEIVKKILSNIPPPNKPSTKAQKKGGGRTLVADGFLRKAIDFKVA